MLYTEIIKKVLLIIFLSLGFSYNTFAYTTDDVYINDVFITDKNVHSITTIPTGRDLVITRIDSSNNNTELTIYNNNSAIITLAGNYTYTNLIVIKDVLKLNQNSRRDRYWTIQGYYIDEWADITAGSVDLSKWKYNGDDLIDIWIDFLSNSRLWELYVLYFIRFVTFYITWLVIKWGFITGTLFYKKHFVNKK